jgi:hypothetical protein
MPPIRHNKHEARDSLYDIFKPPCAPPRPSTTGQFILMIKTHYEGTCGQRPLRSKKIHVTCNNCSGTVIDSTVSRNEHNNPAHVRTSLRPGRHQALQISEEVRHSLRARPEHTTDEQLQAMSQFKKLVEGNSETALLKRLGEQDARSVHEWEMGRLIILLSSIFFQITPSDKMQVHFLWKEVLSTPNEVARYFSDYIPEFITSHIKQVNGINVSIGTYNHAIGMLRMSESQSMDSVPPEDRKMIADKKTEFLQKFR